jgi:hypothetical protein
MTSLVAGYIGKTRWGALAQGGLAGELAGLKAACEGQHADHLRSQNVRTTCPSTNPSSREPAAMTESEPA